MARISRSEILWNQVSRTCFQDREMPFAYWLSAITNPNHHEHKKVLDQSLAMLRGADFVKLIGEREFKKLWKNIRNNATSERASVKQGKIILDGLWSIIMTGFAYSNINIDIQKPFNKGLKATYLDICKQSTKNIYQVAKDTNRPYNRVHEDVKKLSAIGLITVKSTKNSGRSVILLSSI